MARFVLSKSKLMDQYYSIYSLGKISYSFKTNPNVGKILERMTTCDFSVHFINELGLIEDKSRVWFLAQALNNAILDRLFADGVSRFVIENGEDLDLLLGYISRHNRKIELLVRMRLKENTVKTERYYVFGFGVDDVNRIVPELRSNEFISKLGIHFHRKTQNVAEWDLVHELSEIIDEPVWCQLDYFNIGGGLPAMYKNISDKVVPSVMAQIRSLAEFLASKEVKLIIEPGRYLSAPCVRLETVVVGVHGNTVVVDASVYNASPDTLIVPIKLLIEGEVDEADGLPFMVKGITPCSTDLFRYRVYLKRSPAVGDKMVFLNAGAYNFHTEFCELDKIETVVEE